MVKTYKKIKSKAFVTLIGVIVFGSVCISLVVAILMLGIGSSKTSIAVYHSRQALFAAHACAEEALETIRENHSFAGNGNLTLDAASCNFAVTDKGGESRNVASSGSVGTITRKVEIEIDAISPVINVTSWQEVADF
ncbi:MAG: hypothetical protein KBC12_00970 [Candidatus Pacebacteria bacterium]|nr:hypothetical protein [Candidatus Paceibacterota bacterium]MBP9851503.1 hypothetical protein [Candidatus Paceibacterota bacterium]